MSYLTMHKTQCCAFQEIGGLSMYANTPREAMIDFCKDNILKPVKYGSSTARQDTIYSYYVFTAALNRVGERTYGSDFAKFIEEHKLGVVWASSVERNMAFHSDHYNQIWVWTPNRKAILTWWEGQEKRGNVGNTVSDTVTRGKSLRPVNPGSHICPRCGKSWFKHNGWNCGDGGLWPEFEEEITQPVAQPVAQQLGLVEEEDEPEEDDPDEDDPYADDYDEPDYEDDEEPDYDE